jgi:D-beta-D-heptose 7-phosphate kinase/D-beta-D-heptose 1-phosphate adenosyltransferase
MIQPSEQVLISMTSLPDFSRARVLVVGDVMLDSHWQGHTSRISPEAPVRVVRVDRQEVRVGGTCNVALNASTRSACKPVIMPKPAAVALTNIAAGIVVAKLGATTVSRAELGNKIQRDSI